MRPIRPANRPFRPFRRCRTASRSRSRLGLAGEDTGNRALSLPGTVPLRADRIASRPQELRPGGRETSKRTGQPGGRTSSPREYSMRSANWPLMPAGESSHSRLCLAGADTGNQALSLPGTVPSRADRIASRRRSFVRAGARRANAPVDRAAERAHRANTPMRSANWPLMPAGESSRSHLGLAGEDTGNRALSLPGTVPLRADRIASRPQELRPGGRETSKRTGQPGGRTSSPREYSMRSANWPLMPAGESSHSRLCLAGADTGNQALSLPGTVPSRADRIASRRRSFVRAGARRANAPVDRAAGAPPGVRAPPGFNSFLYSILICRKRPML